MNKRREGFRTSDYVLFGLALLLVTMLCVCAGSVSLPVSDTLDAVAAAIRGLPAPDTMAGRVVVSVRLPRVLCVALVGAALSLCGGAMQGLLRNPLADGSTLGVSSGAALGAALAIAFDVSIPGLPKLGVTGMAILFAFLSLLAILSLAYRLDYSLATNTIILIGVVFSMFVGSILSLVIAFAGSKVGAITFWTMGSLSGSTYKDAVLLLFAVLLLGTPILLLSRELNAFAVGEDNARSIGVDVRKVKLTILICASALIGVCVSVGGTIGFVGLVMPHILRLLVGPNHRRLMPACILGGACFLMLADLIARMLLSPLELPVGVVTSFIGSIIFVLIFFRSRKGTA